MEKKYLYRVMFGEVRRIEISRETEKSYWTMNGYRENKNSSYQKTFNTLEEANSFLKEYLKERIEGLKQGISGNKKRLAECEKELEALENL